MQFLYFIYGITCYIIFFGTFLYAIGFVGNFFVPKSMDVGAAVPFVEALITNLLLLGVFAVQHSVMARKSFKEKWAKIIPAALERNTYVLLSSLALILLFWYWKPMGDEIWDVSGTTLGNALVAISLIGWLTVLVSTFLIDHFELFGLKQAYSTLTGKTFKSSGFKTPGPYQFVRHPIYFGFTIAFWATPVMTTAHLLFAIATLGYTIIGVFLEEKDLVATFGEDYKKYKSKVSMLFPLPPKK